MDRIRRRYDQVYRHLGRAQLQRGAEGLDALRLDELFGPDRALWLGFYTDEGLQYALEEYGFIGEIRALGYEDVRVQTRTDDPDEHMLRLVSRVPKHEEPLLELVVRRSFLTLSEELRAEVSQEHLPVLHVEWLMLQHPLMTFSADRPPLPGQRLPGLGLGRQVFELLRNICRRLKLAALVTTPSFFHNAVFYSEGFSFMEPRAAGCFAALRRDLMAGLGLSVAEATWAIRWGLVREEGGAVFEWFHAPMIAPVRRDMEGFLAGAWYRREVDQVMRQRWFGVIQPRLVALMEARGIKPLDLGRVEAWLAEEQA